MAFSSGKYFPEAAAGRVFIGSTIAAGKALALSTATSVTGACLWNTSTTHNAVLLRATAGFTSGTIALGEYGLAGDVELGFAEGSGAPMAAFTEGVFGTDFKNALMGKGFGSQMKFSPGATATTLTTASEALLWFGSYHSSATATSNAGATNFDFDGQVIVTPGSAVWFCGSLAQTALITTSLVWAEIPIS